MPIPRSTAPAVRAYLFTQLTALLASDPDSPSSSLLVCYNDPGPNQPDDIVSVGKVTREIEIASMVGGGGAGWLNERYTIDVLVEVYRGGDFSHETFDRASFLADSVIDLVRSDPSLGGLVVVAKPIHSSLDCEWSENHMGRVAEALVQIEVTHRI